MRRREVAALSEDQAAIETSKDQTLTCRRKTGLRPGWVCLLREQSQ